MAAVRFGYVFLDKLKFVHGTVRAVQVVGSGGSLGKGLVSQDIESINHQFSFRFMKNGSDSSDSGFGQRSSWFRF